MTGTKPGKKIRSIKGLSQHQVNRGLSLIIFIYSRRYVCANQAKSANEKLRATRSGGHIGLVNWTPVGFVGQLFKIVSSHVPPPAGLQPPVLWGTEPQLVNFSVHKPRIFVANIITIIFTKNPQSTGLLCVRILRASHKAYQVLDEESQQALIRDITTLLEQMNTAGKEPLVIPAEYLEAVITRE